MAPKTETVSTPDPSSLVAPSSPDNELSSCEATAMCSTSTSPSAPPALQSDSERSALINGASGEEDSDKYDSNTDDSDKDYSEGDDSDHEEAEVASTTPDSSLSFIPGAQTDNVLPQHIVNNWASCSSSPSIPQAQAEKDLPAHIMSNCASCSSSPSSSSSSCSCSSSCCCSASSSECSEDSEEVRATLSKEQVQVTSTRTEVLHQAEGVGFMASLSDMNEGEVTKGKRIGGGGGGDIFELEMVDCDLQEELLSFTAGAGVVLKTFKKVSTILL